MFTTVLIMIIAINGNSVTSIDVKFQTHSLCQKAKIEIERQLEHPRRIISSGCYEQGRVQ